MVFMSVNDSAMLALVANIKSLVIEGSCSPVNCCHRLSQSEACVNIKKKKEKKKFGGIMT